MHRKAVANTGTIRFLDIEPCLVTRLAIVALVMAPSLIGFKPE